MDITDKIHKIEALIAGAKCDGERQAAEFTKQFVKEKINTCPVEYTVRSDSYSPYAEMGKMKKLEILKNKLIQKISFFFFSFCLT